MLHLQHLALHARAEFLENTDRSEVNGQKVDTLKAR
jgi:hypothetical protein